jgi:hypothetical protein
MATMVQPEMSSKTVNCHCYLAMPCRKLVGHRHIRYNKMDEGQVDLKWNKRMGKMKTLQELQFERLV